MKTAPTTQHRADKKALKLGTTATRLSRIARRSAKGYVLNKNFANTTIIRIPEKEQFGRIAYST